VVEIFHHQFRRKALIALQSRKTAITSRHAEGWLGAELSAIGATQQGRGKPTSPEQPVAFNERPAPLSHKLRGRFSDRNR